MRTTKVTHVKKYTYLLEAGLVPVSEGIRKSKNGKEEKYYEFETDAKYISAVTEYFKSFNYRNND